MHVVSGTIDRVQSIPHSCDIDRSSPNMSHTITLDHAEKAISAGQIKAAELGMSFTICVLDASGHLVTLARMDGAPLAAGEASQAKARASVLFRQPTRALAAAVQPGAPMFGIESSFRDPVTFVPGGIPVTNENGALIGAIGVAGSTPDDDDQVAEAVGAVFPPPAEEFALTECARRCCARKELRSSYANAARTVPARLPRQRGYSPSADGAAGQRAGLG
jgi:uncharacterized protein GlcG (DUF336 family)